MHRNKISIIKQYDEKKGRVEIAILSLVCLVLQAIIINLNRGFPNGILFGEIVIDTSSVSGIFTSMQIAVCVFMLFFNYKIGIRVGCVILLFMLCTVTVACVRYNNYSALPGVAVNFFGLGMIIVLYFQLDRIFKTNRMLKELSETDFLTGCLNRRGIEKCIEERITNNKEFYLLFFDLDDFKNVNDTMGHKFGDKVLCEAAKRWVEIGGNRPFARNGGDEFIMLVDEMSEEQICDFMRDCLSSICRVFSIGDYNYYASASIGAAKYPDGKTAEQLMRYADTAMYHAKRSGKNHYCIFNPEMTKLFEDNLILENELRHALKYDRFELVFQPQHFTRSCKIRGFEALIRLTCEDGRVLNPNDFIPIAEKSKLILDIDHWVLKKSIDDFMYIMNGIDEKLMLSVNVSAKHLREPGFAEEVISVLQSAGFSPECFELEITEYCVISSIESVLVNLNKLKKYGISIALDDFGTGYASLNYLSQMPIDMLKIDKAFIDKLSSEEENDFIKAVISLGHTLDCEVLSEGVELEEQVDALKKLDCDVIQGYIWGRPMSKADARGMLNTKVNVEKINLNKN